MSTETIEDERAHPPLWIAPAAVLVGFAAGLFGTFLVEAIGAAFGSSTTHPTAAVNNIANFVFDAGFVGSALYLSVVTRSMGRAEFGYRRIPWRLGAGAVLVAGVTYYVVTLAYAAIVNVHGADTLPSDLGVHNSTWAALAACLFVCAAAPIAEEFFFRGFLFGVLRQMRISVFGRQIGTWVAALIVALIFGLAHSGSAKPAYLIPLAFLGFVLCIVRWKTRSLYPCMALHSINNSVAMGVNEFHWNAGEIVALIVGSLALIALITGPLSRGVGNT
jgi:uncharacterized protein